MTFRQPRFSTYVSLFDIVSELKDKRCPKIYPNLAIGAIAPHFFSPGIAKQGIKTPGIGIIARFFPEICP